MKLLLDTNTFVRWLTDTPLPRGVERILAKQQTEILVSIVTCWEVVMKPKLGRSTAEVEAGIADLDAVLLPIKFTHLDALSRMPVFAHHRDPFDRMLIAQAIAEDVSIVSSDMRFGGYQRLRVLWD